MTDTLSVSGQLRPKDLRRLTKVSRGGTVGPTALYYAGVTAPIITASLALVVKEGARHAGFTPYWQLMVPAFAAAFGGIAWYLIFTRWAYRHRAGRGTEGELETGIIANEAGLCVRRGDIETRIGWPAVTDLVAKDHYLSISVRGSDALIIPDAWFGKDRAGRDSFAAYLRSRIAP